MTKRADLPTWWVVRIVSVFGTSAYEAFVAAGFPDKVVVRAFERDIRAGYLDCGVSSSRPFLTPDGERLLHR